MGDLTTVLVDFVFSAVALELFWFFLLPSFLHSVSQFDVILLTSSWMDWSDHPCGCRDKHQCMPLSSCNALPKEPCRQFRKSAYIVCWSIRQKCHSFDWLCCYYVFLVITGSQIMVPSTLMDEAMLLPCAYPSGIAKQFPQRQPGNDNIYHQSLLESSTRVAAELLAISACIKSAELKK